MSSDQNDINALPTEVGDSTVEDSVVAVQDKTGDTVTALILNEEVPDSEWVEAEPDDLYDLEEVR